jgi:hypothetical protein
MSEADDRVLMVTVHRSTEIEVHYSPTLTREELLDALSRVEHLASTFIERIA